MVLSSPVSWAPEVRPSSRETAPEKKCSDRTQGDGNYHHQPRRPRHWGAGEQRRGVMPARSGEGRSQAWALRGRGSGAASSFLGEWGAQGPGLPEPRGAPSQYQVGLTGPDSSPLHCSETGFGALSETLDGTELKLSKVRILVLLHTRVDAPAHPTPSGPTPARAGMRAGRQRPRGFRWEQAPHREAGVAWLDAQLGQHPDHISTPNPPMGPHFMQSQSQSLYSGLQGPTQSGFLIIPLISPFTTAVLALIQFLLHRTCIPRV